MGVPLAGLCAPWLHWRALPRQAVLLLATSLMACHDRDREKLEFDNAAIRKCETVWCGMPP